MKKTIFTMIMAVATTLMVSCGGRSTDCGTTNDTVSVSEDSVCDSVVVVTDTVPNDSAVVE